MENQSMHDLVVTLKNSLTAETWNKKHFFSFKNNKLCMCVHGAAQALVNPQIRFSNTLLVPGVLSVSGNGLRAAETNSDKLAAYNNMPHCYAADYIADDQNYGSRKIHYLLGMFGITAAFNDHKDTTIEMLHAKLDEVIEFCRVNSL